VLKGRRVKTTLVAVPNTLLGQWSDEVPAFAPGLVTCVLYGSAGKQVTAENIGEVNVLITTLHTRLPVSASELVFHRLIVDESHLLDAGRDAASAWGPAQHKALLGVQAPSVWLATGTLFVLEGGSLTWANQLSLYSLCWDTTRAGCGSAAARSLTRPCRRSIGHLACHGVPLQESQRIHGEAALSLPEAAVQTTLLEMTDDERALYRLSACADGTPDWMHAQYTHALGSTRIQARQPEQGCRTAAARVRMPL